MAITLRGGPSSQDRPPECNPPPASSPGPTWQRREGLQLRAMHLRHRPRSPGVWASAIPWQPDSSPLKHECLRSAPGETEAQRGEPFSSGLGWLAGLAAGTSGRPLAKHTRPWGAFALLPCRSGQVRSRPCPLMDWEVLQVGTCCLRPPAQSLRPGKGT